MKNTGAEGIGSPMIKTENYDEIKTALKHFLVIEVEHYSMRVGSQEQLSATLNRSERYVRNKLARGSFGSLERLWKECIDKLGVE